MLSITQGRADASVHRATELRRGQRRGWCVPAPGRPAWSPTTC